MFVWILPFEIFAFMAVVILVCENQLPISFWIYDNIFIDGSDSRKMWKKVLIGRLSFLEAQPLYK